MASSSSSSSSSTTYNNRFDVFPSYHGPDVRAGFLSHLRKQFSLDKIKMFNDQGIEKSQKIASSLKRAIRESKISIVILSKNYASSSWCLYELVEILECAKAEGHVVTTIFYGVDPYDVQNQTGDFGIAFNETFAMKTVAERWKWRQALTYVSKIPGEHLLKWDNEANMIQKIARDISDKLNVILLGDFDFMVGLEAHLREIQSLLDLDDDGVKMVAIYGPPGIGKTTIAGALHTLLSSSVFQLSCFMENLKGSFNSGLDEYGLKMCLQKQLLSKVGNQNGMSICHLGAGKENLSDQKVLIILDDVDDLKQLEALVNVTTWVGPGSRIVVTTENKELLQQHGINKTYHMGFPSSVEALEILRRYAFRQSYRHLGFQEFALRISELCGNLPLGLRVMGSSLYGKEENEWEEVMRKLETILDHRDIEQVLRVGYESLQENEQTLFLHIAVFFNYKDSDLVKAMFADNNLDVKHALKALVDKSLIHISNTGEIVMHKLLQQVGRQAVQREEPQKRQVLIDALEICDAIEGAEGTRAVSGISFDISGIDEVSISKKAFKRMPNLRFLKVYKSKDDGNDVLHISEELDLPPRLRLLQWQAFPSKCLPPTFHPEHLVELDMKSSHLEKLWKGTQALTNLRKMDLSDSRKLKKLPDLSNALNLETLELSSCESLVELPSSIANLHNLQDLCMQSCTKLEVLPTNINLASLEKIDMSGCSRLRIFPDISTNVGQLFLSGTAVKEVPASICLWSRVRYIDLSHCINLKRLTNLPTAVKCLNLSNSGVERITYCMRDLHGLEELNVSGCRNLESLPELPTSITLVTAEDCESLARVTHPLNIPNAQLNFTNCFKLGGEARRLIIQRSFFDGIACLPGSVIPSVFNHRAKGNCLTIGPFSASSRFEACVIISPDQHQYTREDIYLGLRYRILGKSGDAIYRNPVSVSVQNPSESPEIQTKHLCIFHCDLPREEICLEVGIEILFELSNSACGPLDDCEITECGVRILTDEWERSSDDETKNNGGINQVSDWSYEFEQVSKVLEDSEDEFVVTSDSEASQDCD